MHGKFSVQEIDGEKALEKVKKKVVKTILIIFTLCNLNIADEFWAFGKIVMVMLPKKRPILNVAIWLNAYNQGFFSSR